MNERKFNEWLENNSKDKYRSKRDRVSRCKRIERLFDVDLDKMKNNDKYYDGIQYKLEFDLKNYVSENIDIDMCRSQLRSALKHYKLFLES